MSIGALLKQERIKNKLSQEEVAKAIGATKQAVYKYENEIVTNIPLDKIEIMARLFGVAPAYLMGWTDKRTIDLQLFAEKNPPSDLTEGERLWLEVYRRTSEDTRTIFINMMKQFDSLPEDRQALALSVIRAALGEKR